MDRKQKEELRFLLKARKRADKVLAQQREDAQKKLDYKMRKEANHELMEQYTQELTALARESGILAMAEQAALALGGSLTKQVSYYIDYGFSTSSLQHILAIEDQGKLRASHLALRIIWGQTDALLEAEIRVHQNGQITYHNCILPVFPFFWRHYPQLLKKMFTSALEHPRPSSEPVKKND